MHPFFEPLDHREMMLLLTTLTVGGSAEVSVFERLPAAQKQRLQEKAQALLAIPAEKRVTFMVHEIKQALSFKGLRGVEKVDPSWLIQGMKGESPRVVAAVLVSLPAPTVRGLIEKLPPAIRQKLPPKEEMKRLPLELVRSVRQIFESRFHAMPQPSPKGFAFKDVLQLERAEIYKVMRDLGLLELGQAFVSVGKMALAELCRRLPRESAEELILAVRSASQDDLPDLKTAQRFLARVVPNFTSTDEFFQKAGLWRIAKGFLLEDEAHRNGFKQRLPREAGQLFEGYLEKAAEMEGLDEGVLKRLRDAVLVRVKVLASRGEISERWAEVEMSFHDPEVAKAALAGAGASQPPPANPEDAAAATPNKKKALN